MNFSKLIATIIILFLVYFFFDQRADRDDSGQIVSEGAVDVFQVRIGDCFNDSEENALVSSIGGIPCNSPHDNEIYAKTLIPQGEYPGEEPITDIAYQYCLESFEDFVGTSYEDSLLNITYLYPTQESWNSILHDRDVFCIVYDMTGEKMLGSMENSRY